MGKLAFYLFDNSIGLAIFIFYGGLMKKIYCVILILIMVHCIQCVDVSVSYSPYSFSDFFNGVSENQPFVHTNGVYHVNLYIEDNKPNLVFTLFYEYIHESGYEYLNPGDDGYYDDWTIEPPSKEYYNFCPRIGFLVGPQFYYLKTDYISLYTNFQIGMGYKRDNHIYSGYPCIQINPIGIKIGNKFSIYTEGGIGVKGFVSYGMSYRF